METRVALVGIIVENEASVAKLNELLHRYGSYIIGRMGLPYREKGVNIISVVLDAPQDIISALSGQIGRLDGVSSPAEGAMATAYVLAVRPISASSSSSAMPPELGPVRPHKRSSTAA